MISLSPEYVNELTYKDRDSATRGNLPNILERAFVQHEFPLPRAPVTWAIVYAKPKFAGFLIGALPSLPSADYHESPIRVEDDEVTLEIADKIELHLCKLGVVRRKVFYAQPLIAKRCLASRHQRDGIGVESHC